MPFPKPDRDQLSRFVRALYAKALPNTWVNLRSFVDGGNSVFAAQSWQSRLVSEGLDAIVDAAANLAETCASSPTKAVFCPPVCTFSDRAGTSEAVVACGLAIMIEIDKDPQRTLARATAVLGTPTLVIESGGLWLNPETQMEEARLHVYWVLETPTTTPDGHALLKEARELASRLVGSDTSAAPLNHPLRWPGSWHRKAEPRLCQIIDGDETRRIDLLPALDALRAASPPSSPAAASTAERDRDAEFGPAEGEHRAPIEDVKSALEQIPNQDVEWDEWNAVGMATFVATSGTDEGLSAFDLWSKKSTKYEHRDVLDRWRTWTRTPPNRTGAGKLFRLARDANTKWKRPSLARSDDDASAPTGWRKAPNGRITKDDPHNARVALRRLRVALSYDEFADKVIYVNGRDQGELSEAEFNTFYIKMLEQNQYKPSVDFLLRCCTVFARERSFHPVRDRLLSFTWDGKPRIDTWLIDLAGAEVRYDETDEGPANVEYVHAVSRLILLGSVARVFHPGCKFDEMLVLESPQGKDKSNAIKTLALEEAWYTDSVQIGIGDKETIEQIGGKWIVEVPELAKFRERDVEVLKGFMSKSHDRARLSYARLTSEVARSCTFWATTNSTLYLRDEQNRRFWPIRVDFFDVRALEAIREQLWAEAVHRFQRGESTKLHPDLYALAAFEQMQRRAEHPWKMTLEDALSGLTGRIHANDVFKLLRLDRTPQGQGTNQDQVVGTAMRELGWERKTGSANGRTGRWYLKGTATQRREVLYVHIDPVTRDAEVGSSPMAGSRDDGF